jgi:hypothetical protein
MIVYQLAAWGIIIGLSLMMVGGMVLWAYGARPQKIRMSASGPEDEAAKLFHQRYARWFFIYGVVMIVIGTGIVFWVRVYFF